ncbi:glutaredoxin family protein [Bacillus sonorensis]|uniref:glutaredoxin family protein n=1 Tax=Bacillus sonorensis TaxID=119858 RepID=UPI002DBEEAFE|nr:glutaredoxin family protein [Bacillus sonorensis]MEC0341912.1 glutaredoxin family protein [Bacillus sonorensis]MEC0457402.1 glutaredoxin family protein [Bacillus sonorensis]MEC0530803.1 glutaredoxin family protein [Bacillus sonorensis]
MLVVLYSDEKCFYCQKQKEWFDEQNIEYEEKDVSKEENLKEVQRLGAIGVPFTVIYKEYETVKISGLNYKRLKKHLGLN